MIGWLMWGTMLILWFSLLFVQSFMLDRRRKMIFGVTVPGEKMNEPRVMEVMEDFRKKKKLYNSGALILTFPVIFMGSFAWIYSYFNLYLLGFFFAIYGMAFKGNRRMKELKKQQGWNVGEKGAVYVDTGLKEEDISQKQPSAIWLLPALILGFEPLLSAHPLLMEGAWATIGTSLFLWVLALFAFFKVKRTPPKVYTGKTAIDQKVNDTWKGRWMTLILVLTYYFVIFNNVLHRLISGSGGEVGAGFVIIITVGTLLPILALLWMHRMRVAMVEDLKKDHRLLEVDEDDYWIGGMFYYNPDVKKTFVSTRIGVGSTINLGTASGKWIMGGVAVLTIAAIFGSWIFVVAEEFVEPTILWEEDRFFIQSLAYSDEVFYEEIQEVFLVEEIGQRTKTNGSATESYSRGSFRVRNYGPSRLYLFHDSPKIIVMQLEDLTIFYNEPTLEATEEMLFQLHQRLEE